MTYDPRRENFAHLRRIATGLADFSGRSRRSEFLVYLIAMMIIWAVALVLIRLVAGSGGIPYGQYYQMALWLPATSLFVRRLHDQNRSGWLALILPALVGLNIYAQTLFDAGRLSLPSFGFPLNIAEGVLVIAFWLFVLWPGSEGANRYGPDPRLEPALDVR